MSNNVGTMQKKIKKKQISFSYFLFFGFYHQYMPYGHVAPHYGHTESQFFPIL